MRNLARRLAEVSQTAPDPHVQEAAAVNEKLRIPLTRFAGTEGYASLARRALVLARAEMPSLQDVNVDADGRFEGIKQLTTQTDSGTAREASAAVAAHLLELLVTFIGKPLRSSWCARPGLTHLWTSTIREPRRMDERQTKRPRQRSRRGPSGHSEATYRRAGSR